jgi:hypothetical protein
VSGSVVTRYPALFKAVTDIERRRQEELIETPRAYSDPTMGYTIQYLVENGIIEGPIVKPGTNTYLRIKEGVDKLNAEINAKYDAELKALEEQQASSETTIQQTITIEELAQQQEAAAIGVGPSKLAREYIDRILSSKTEAEASRIGTEASEKLKPAELPYLRDAYKKARANNQWSDVSKVKPVTFTGLKKGDNLVNKEGSLHEVVSIYEGTITLKEIDGNNLVILTSQNINDFMYPEDVNKKQPEQVKTSVPLNEEGKKLALDNIDEVTEFVKNTEILANLKEAAKSSDISSLETNLLDNLDC